MCVCVCVCVCTYISLVIDSVYSQRFTTIFIEANIKYLCAYIAIEYYVFVALH